MEIKTYPCHGWKIDRTSMRRGEMVNDKAMASNYFTVESDGKIKGAGLYHWFMVQGKHTHENLGTGVVIEQERGWNTKDSQLSAGDYLLAVVDPSVLFCFNEVANPDGLPEFDFHHVSADTTFQFAAGARWFLMDGQFTLNGVTRSQPRAFTMSERKLVTFDTDSMFIVLRD